MLNLNDRHKAVLQQYSRPIVHMRRQVIASRFGLVFGAGVSKRLGLPNWPELVEELAKDPEVHGENILQVVPPRAGSPYKTEMLFEHFTKKRYAAVPPAQHHTRAIDYRIAADWREIVRRHLYAGVTADLSASLYGHPYLEQYLPLIRQSHMTVTYNFDDFLEQALLLRRRGDEQSRGFESVTNPWTQFRRTTAIIYHPNGVVPQNVLETPSDRFVFSEASYADQLMGIFAGDQAGLLNHFSKHTCLLIGLSLEDETLRNVLMQAARACPGNFHYYVQYLKPGEDLDDEKRSAITGANFKVYNLVTLFLDDDGIRAVGEMINLDVCQRDQFCDFAAEHNIPVRFRFYVTGALGVGKSTAINHFRNLVVLDEWLDERPAILAKDFEKLDAPERDQIDEWIAGQFRRKNDVLRNEREGIFVLDRGPLDPLCFTPDGEWRAKAGRLLGALCPGQARWRVEDGRVILLRGDGSELALRMVMTQRKDYTAGKLCKMEAQLERAYGSVGVTAFDTRGLTPSDVARRVGEIVHLEPYDATCSLHQRFEQIATGALGAEETVGV
jgi:hypothetical protein